MINSPFTAYVGKWISVIDAKKLIEAHRLSAPAHEAHSFFVGKDKIQQVISYPESTGLRIHLGKAEDGTTKLIIYPADENGNNISVKLAGSDEEVALDFMLPCPPYCSGE